MGKPSPGVATAISSLTATSTAFDTKSELWIPKKVKSSVSEWYTTSDKTTSNTQGLEYSIYIHILAILRPPPPKPFSKKKIVVFWPPPPIIFF